MEWFWFVVNTATGAYGTHSSSHSPMQQTTTVTVDGGTPEVNTVSANTAKASTTTTYANTVQVTVEGTYLTPVGPNAVVQDASGNKWNLANVVIEKDGTATTTATCEVTDKAVSLASGTNLTIVTDIESWTGAKTAAASTTTETTVTVEFDPNLVQQGFSIVGPYNDSDTPMDATTQAAFDTSAAYLYQNGTFVANPNYNADAVALAQAQANANNAINAGFAQTMNNGFQFTVSGTPYTMGWRQDDSHNDRLHLTQIQQAITNGEETFPVPYADINGGPVSLPDQATLTNFEKTANSFEWAQALQRRKLYAQVAAAQKASDAQAIQWEPAAYTDAGTGNSVTPAV